MRISDWSSDVCSSDLDGQGCEAFAETESIGEYAAADALQLVDSADDAIPLKLEQLVPDGRVADARRGLDNPLLVQLVAQIPEQLVEHLKIKQRRWAMARSHVKADGKLARVRFHSAPICLKPVGECLRFCFCIGKLDRKSHRL